MGGTLLLLLLLRLLMVVLALLQCGAQWEWAGSAAHRGRVPRRGLEQPLTRCGCLPTLQSGCRLCQRRWACQQQLVCYQ